jgi:hypothetical protein
VGDINTPSETAKAFLESWSEGRFHEIGTLAQEGSNGSATFFGHQESDAAPWRAHGACGYRFLSILPVRRHRSTALLTIAYLALPFIFADYCHRLQNTLVRPPRCRLDTMLSSSQSQQRIGSPTAYCRMATVQRTWLSISIPLRS